MRHPNRGIVRVTRRDKEGFHIQPWDPDHPFANTQEPETYVFRGSFEHRRMSFFHLD